jgi:hypothetical protein
MTEAQYNRAIFFGRISWWIVMTLPIGWATPRLMASAGFYAYDEGYEAYRLRGEAK